MDASTATTFVVGDGAVLKIFGDAADVSGTFTTDGPATETETVTWSGSFVASAPLVFDFAPGVFTLAGSVDVSGTTGLTNNGEVTWSGGTITGPVSNAGLLLTTTGSVDLTLDGSFVNEVSGTVRQQQNRFGPLLLAPDSTFTNHGLHDITGDSGVAGGSGTGADPSYTNTITGTLRKSGASTCSSCTTTIASNVDFSNEGAVEVSAGTLRSEDPTLTQLQSTTLTGGTWRVLKGSAPQIISSASITEIGTGATVAQAVSGKDELITFECDLDQGAYLRETTFNFARHRRVEHYGPITERAGVVLPPE